MTRRRIKEIGSCLRAATVAGIFSATLLTSCAAAHNSEDGRLDPDVASARDLIDSWTGQSESLDAALKKINKALASNPENVFALKEMARYQIKAGYLSSRPVEYKNHVYTAGVFQPGTLERAEVTIRSAIRIDPKFAEGYILLSNIQFSQMKFDEATQSLRKAEALGSTDPWLQLNWASIDDAKGDDVSAEARWRKVLQSDTNNNLARASATSFLLASYVKSGDHEKVVGLYEHMIKLSPDDAWLRGNFATYLSENLSRNDEAITQARAALNIMDYGVGHRILAMALYRKWGEVLALKPSDDTAEKYFLEAQENYPQLNLAMAYGASVPGAKHLAEALIHKGVSIDSQAEDGSTALLIATNLNRDSVVKTLLGLDANPNIASNSGWTPLLSAADEGNTEIVSSLLKKGADVRATLGGRNSSEMAAEKGHTELAKQLKAAETANK